MAPIILDLSPYELGSDRIRVQDYAIWSGKPDSPLGVVRYHLDGQQKVSANRADRHRRVFLDLTGHPHIDGFFRKNRNAIFDAVALELHQVRPNPAEQLATALPKLNVVVLRKSTR